MSQAIIRLSPQRVHRAESGHPWIYDNEIAAVDGDVAAGAVVTVVNAKGRFVGRGVANPKSKIRVRLLTRHEHEACDGELVRRRVREAWAFRQKIGYTKNCRVVFGEADFIPGLVVDKFGDVLVMQTTSLAAESFKDDVVAVLLELFKPRGIFERSDVPVREREGLKQQKGFLTDAFDTRVMITEPDDVKFLLDVAGGQKTGFFLDQKENRTALKNLVNGASVLDAFSYTGSFAMYAAKYGAKSVRCLDQSGDCLAIARENAALNGVAAACSFEEANAFDALNAWTKEGQKFDVVMLDPPAFAKNRAGLSGALRGYKDVNLRGMQLVKPGGFLVTSSCSHFVTPDLFAGIVFEAARDARRTVRQVHFGLQAKDHPVLWGFEESLYLKFLVLQVV